MVGSSKLLKINYRLQDLSAQNKCKDFMGGTSFVASGKSETLLNQKNFFHSSVSENCLVKVGLRTYCSSNVNAY